MPDQHLPDIVRFLDGIGIPVELRPLEEKTFLPGILVDRGRLRVDAERLLSSGDLLHEAGHIAVMPSEERAGLYNSVGDDLGMEIAAIAWSWAALTHIGLPPQVVFHDQGYRGHSGAYIENFEEGRYVGVPLLAWFGMTCEVHKAEEIGEKPFPHMIKWLRD